jgi:hypothetical protein
MSYITTAYEITDEDGTVTESIDLRVHYVFFKGRPATMYARNGDPGDPGEPDEIEHVATDIMVGTRPVRVCGGRLDEWAAAWLDENRDLVIDDVVDELAHALEARAESARDDERVEKLNAANHDLATLRARAAKYDAADYATWCKQTAEHPDTRQTQQIYLDTNASLVAQCRGLVSAALAIAAQADLIAPNFNGPHSAIGANLSDIAVAMRDHCCDVLGDLGLPGERL